MGTKTLSFKFDAAKEVEKRKEIFSKHEIHTIVDQNGVTRFSFRRPDSGMYGFSLTCADNLIVMNGDCYSLLVEPGYGRNGLAFLLSNVCRDPFYYFLSKVPNGFRDGLTEYSSEKAEEHIKYYIEECEYKLDLSEWVGRGEDGKYGEWKYYEFCHDNNVDEPMDPRILDSQTILQIAGLQCFVEQYKSLNNITEED